MQIIATWIAGMYQEMKEGGGGGRRNVYQIRRGAKHPESLRDVRRVFLRRDIKCAICHAKRIRGNVLDDDGGGEASGFPQ